MHNSSRARIVRNKSKKGKFRPAKSRKKWGSCWRKTRMWVLVRTCAVTRSTFNRITRLQLRWHPYRMHVRHEILDTDWPRRLRFCNWFTTVSDWAWTRVFRTRMFLRNVNVRVAMRKLPRFQGQTFQNVNSRMTIDQTETFALGNVAVSA